MKNKKILFVSTAVLILCGCGKTSSSTSSSDDKTSISSIVASSSGTAGSSVSSSTGNTVTALQLFDQALKKDYGNVTVESYQSYDDGEMSELDYEFVDDGYVVNYSYSLAESGVDEDSCYLFYYDDNGTCYTYWDADETVPNSKGGWVNKGYQNADLSIWKSYFYLPKLLSNITVDDIAYQQGIYYVKDIDKVDELNFEAFGYAWYNDIIDICFTLNADGYIEKIYGFCDEGSGDPVNYVLISLFDFGTTSLPKMANVPAFSDETKTTYWEYKGWPHDYTDAYYSNISTTLTPNQNLNSDENFDVIADLDDTFTVDLKLLPESFEAWEILHEEDRVVTWHYDETILEKNYSYVQNQSVFRAIGSGETDIYASVNGKDGTTLTSQPVKVKVNPAAVQDKSDAVYDFVFASIDENKKVIAQNNADSKALYDITAGPGVSLLNGQYSDLFTENRPYLVVDPISQEVINNSVAPGLYFDFGEQQVSKISFNYGLFYENHKSYLSRLKSVTIRTSDDGDTWDEIDITDEIKENISTSFSKLIEKEFAPASKVQLVVKGTMIGNSLGIVFDSLCFSANDQCHNYVDPGDVVHVESVTVSPSSVEMYEEDTTTLIGTVAPQNATDKSLIWHVKEGEDCVSLNNGTLTALKAGTAVVYATSVDGEIASNEVTVTVNEKPSFNAYLNTSYKDENTDWTVEIIDAYTARISDGTVTIEATISGFKNDVYTLTNSDGEGFCLEWSRTRVDITKIKYLKNGVLTDVGGTKYCDLQVFMTNFTVKVGSLKANEEGKYDVLVGNTVYLSLQTVSPSNANVKTVTYETSDASKATVSDQGAVTFVGSGEVTVTVRDSHNPSLYKEIVFVVQSKTYPTDDNWELRADGDEVEVGGKVNFSVTFDPEINTDKTVTYSVDDGELASITQNGVLTAKAEGTVTVTASVKTETGTSTKTKTILIKPLAQGDIPAEVRGVWMGEDDNGTSFTFTVDETGATLEYTDYNEEEHVYTFEYMGIQSGEYVFQCVEQDSVTVSIYLSSASSDNAKFTMIDEEGVINDFITFVIYSDYVSIER